MAAHTLLCVEPDPAALATIRGALEPYGFEITNITNGEDAVAWGRQNPPALVIVSVEPRKVGYAICNKFKRSPELKDIPLILSSGEETPQQLEQHRKLKVKANEYLVKPFSAPELLEKVREVYPLSGINETGEARDPDVGVDEDDLVLSSEVLEEISIGDSDIVDVDGQELVVEAGDFEEESTQTAGPLNGVFDPETDAAFAAIQQQQPSSMPAASPAAMASPWESVPNRWDADAASAVDIGEDEVDDALAKLTEPSDSEADSEELFVGAGQPTPVPPTNNNLPTAESFVPALSDRDVPTPMPSARAGFDDDDNDDSPFSLPASDGDTGEVNVLADFDGAPEAPAQPAVRAYAAFDDEPADGASQQAPAPKYELDGDATPGPQVIAAGISSMEVERQAQRLVEALAERDVLAAEKQAADDEIQALRAQRDQLAREVDEIRNRPQIAASARDREILNLREVINKKERDLLDIRDQFDARERQILDHKDRIRENERARRDLEDKNLGLEKALMDANERVEAVTNDKQKSAEREKILKARLDDAHVEIQKAHDEVESLKKRGLATEERLRSEMDRARGALEARILEMEESHRAELAQLAEERAKAETTLEQEHNDELARLRATHASELEATQRKAAEELSALDERMQAEIQRMRKDHEKAAASQKEELSLQLAAEREAHQTALEAKERGHRNEILGMRRRNEEELQAAEARRQKELEEAELRGKIELEAAENRRRAELQARDEQHNAQVADMDRRQFEEKTQAAERHRAEMDEAHARASRAEGDLAARTEELSEARRRISGLESDLDATRADLRDREVKISQANLRVSELEIKTTQYEEQIMRSYQRLRSDDKVIEKAKRALAVALSLLEERGMAPTQTPSEISNPNDDLDQATSNDGGDS